MRKRGVVQVVRTRPHVHEGDAPETDDRQPIGEDRAPGTHWKVVVHHAEEAGGQEERDRVMPVPPLRHRILHAGECRVALGMAERDRNRQIVDDMEDRHDQNEGHVVPIRNVDVRLLAANQCAQIDNEVSHPHYDQPDVRVPFRLGIFLRLRDAHQIAGCGDDAEQIVTQQHEPRAQLVGQPRA